MRLLFLGTGTSQGIPVIGCRCEVCLSKDARDKRLRSSILIQEKGEDPLIIDCGPDFRYQMLRSDTSRLKAVLLTHEHYDHTAGLDDLRPFNFLTGTSVQLFGDDRVLSSLRTRFPYAFHKERYPGAPQFQTHSIIWNQPLVIDNYQVLPLEVLHGNLHISGFKIGDSLAYITDANGLPEATINTIQNIPILVINALHHRPHHSHFTLEQTIAQIAALNPGRTYLIHMSHHMGLHAQVDKQLPAHIQLAYDGLEVLIP